MQEIQQEVECAARSDAKVLISGEAGVGKEVVARLIHQQSRRRQGPFITVDCANVPDSVRESELFGHNLEQAHAGTVFLDEIGEMSLPMQAALLRFLETGEVQRAGGNGVNSPVDVRIIAVTNRKLHAELSDKHFREDLYYRLNVIHIVMPPLRERKEDLPFLLTEFMRTSSEAHGLKLPTLLTETLDALLAYSWPGNVRELRNVADSMVTRAQSGIVRPADLPSGIINTGRQPLGTPSTADRIFERMTIDRESFWTVVYEPFMRRELRRHDLRMLIIRSLQETRGNYKSLVQLFNVDEADCKRFLSFLRKHDCHMPSQKFRSVPASAESVSGRARRSLTKAS
jgi:DNA-binding NtrC family response regulator